MTAHYLDIYCSCLSFACLYFYTFPLLKSTTSLRVATQRWLMRLLLPLQSSFCSSIVDFVKNHSSCHLFCLASRVTCGVSVCFLVQLMQSFEVLVSVGSNNRVHDYLFSQLYTHVLSLISLKNYFWLHLRSLPVVFIVYPFRFDLVLYLKQF